MMNKIKTGLASYGMSGQIFHAPFISTNPHFELTAILERSKNLSHERYPNAKVVRSIDELLKIDELELIVINTPDHTHYDYALRALEAGKNVIVEKPFTLSTVDGQRLIEKARSLQLMLCVYQNRRYDGDFLTVKKIIEEKSIGRIVEFESTFPRFRNFVRKDTWKEESRGLTFDIGPHLIDQCVTLFGMPDTIFADIATLRKGGKIDDYFIIHPMHCSKAPEVHITLKSSYLMCDEEPRFVIHGTNGSYIKYGLDPQESLLKTGVMPTSPHWGMEDSASWGLLTTDNKEGKQQKEYPTYQGSYTAFYDSVYKHLRLGKPIDTTAENILPVISIIEAAIESSKTKQIISL